MLAAAVARYAAFLRLPDVARMLAMAIVARMPLGTVTLGAAVACPGADRLVRGRRRRRRRVSRSIRGDRALIGRWIDRHGARRR